MLSSLRSMFGLDTIATHNKRQSYKKEPSGAAGMGRSQSLPAFELEKVHTFGKLSTVKSKAYASTATVNTSTGLSSTATAVIPVMTTITDSMTNTRVRSRLSWLDRKIWPFRRDHKRYKMPQTLPANQWPDLSIMFAKDAAEWDEYLTKHLIQTIDSPVPSLTLRVAHDNVDNMRFPLTSDQYRQYANCRAVLLILSSALLDHIDALTDVYELIRLLPVRRTVCILCGVQESDISDHRREILVSFGQWQRIVANDKDKQFVVNVIQSIRDVLQQPVLTIGDVGAGYTKPQFKLSPRKVKEGNGKVFILLDTPVADKQLVQILIDGCVDNEMVVKWKNAYTLYFIIPQKMLKVTKVLNISLIRDSKHMMGTRPVKCETKMSELHGLLLSVDSPFEFMNQTLGFPTLNQFDEELAKRFDQRLPYFGSVFASSSAADKVPYICQKSNSYLPTLLHFASAYGLRELTFKLLHCPMALRACHLRNSNNMTPADMAQHLNHTDIVQLLHYFELQCLKYKSNHLNDSMTTYGQQTVGLDTMSTRELTDHQKASIQRYSVPNRYVIKPNMTGRPPAPLPRSAARTVTAIKQISETTTKAKEVNQQSIGSMDSRLTNAKVVAISADAVYENSCHNKTNNSDSNHSEYYVLESVVKSKHTEDNQINEKFGTTGAKDNASLKNDCLKNTLSITGTTNTNYVNMMATSSSSSVTPSSSQCVNKRDPLINYDLVPSRIPVPINSAPTINDVVQVPSILDQSSRVRLDLYSDL